MDGSGFDALTRTFSELRTRRGLAQVLLGAALGTPALVSLDEAAAKRGAARKRRKRRTQRRERDQREQREDRGRDGAQADKKKGKKKACPPCKKRKKGKCKGKLPDGAACPGGSCRAGSCVPATTPRPDCTPACGNRVCGGDDGCGQSCGTCTGGLSCQDGQCVLCGSGLTGCAGDCVDLQTDAAHCGACGTACNFPHASARCDGGVCTLGACDAGFANCDGDPATGCETEPSTDPANCSACNSPCARPANATATCVHGTCGFTCDAGFHQCGNACVSNDDVAHCGNACDPCPTSVCSPATCDGSTCDRAPIAGCCEQNDDCGDSDACTTDTCGPGNTCQHTAVTCTSSDPCQDPVCDPGHGCGTVDHCAADEVCIADGAQAHCCPQSRPLWDGAACIECTASDLTRCPALPNAIAFCNGAGACDFTCETGWAACGPFPGCQTSLEMYRICGACDNICRLGEECVEGQCRCGGGVACTGEQRCCDGVCRETNTDVHNCGLCGNACPGVGQSTVSATCTGGFCSVGCRGQNYDVNNDLSDGCEELDTQDNHTQETALDLGARSCLNTDTGSFSGTIYSDYLLHTNPPAPGHQLSPSGGAAPLWFKVIGAGGICDPDLRVELTLTSGTMNNGYQVTVITDTAEATATVVGGSAIIDLGGDSYTPGSTIYFRVKKKDPTLAPSEIASFTATFHL